MMETKATLEILDGILKEAIESLDKGEKVNGLEYARALVANLKDIVQEGELIMKVPKKNSRSNKNSRRIFPDSERE